MSGSGSDMYGIGNLRTNSDGNTRRDNSVNTGRTDNGNGRDNNDRNARRQEGDDDGKDNDGINDDVIENIWKDAEDETKKNKVEPVVTAPTNTDTRTPDEKIKAHLKEIGLDNVTLTEEDKEKAKNGDFSGITAAMVAFGQQSYIKAMSSSKTLIDAAVQDAVKKAVTESRSSFEGTRLLEKMHEALPATKDPAIGPMAATVLQRLVNKGMTQEKAIEGVRQYFLRTMKAFDPDYVEPNPNLRGDFRNVPKKSSESKTDWVDLIRG